MDTKQGQEFTGVRVKMAIQFEVPKTEKKAVAIDFDGVIVQNAFPGIGSKIPGVVEFIRRNRKKYVWILWTCRTGERLKEALEFLKGEGITFDYVNENTKDNIARFGTDSRKIYADYYIDDKNSTLEKLHR